MATGANAVATVVKGEEWLKGGGGELSEEKLAFRRAMATRMEKMQFDGSLRPVVSSKDKGAMQERTPNCVQQQLPQQPKLPQQLSQHKILFQWQQQQHPAPASPAFYAGAAAAAAAEARRSRSVVVNGAPATALNPLKGKDGLGAVGQQRMPQLVGIDPLAASSMIVPTTTTMTTTTTATMTTTTTTTTGAAAYVAPATQPGLKKRIACSVPKGMPIRPLPLHGYIDPLVGQAMDYCSSSVRFHHHPHYHGVTTTATASGYELQRQQQQQVVHYQQQQQQQQAQSSFVQGLSKRYKECMDYAHLGCRHFVPCNDPDPSAAGEQQQQQMLKRQAVGSGSNPVMAKVVGGAGLGGNCKDFPVPRGIGVKLEAGRSFLGHFHGMVDPAKGGGLMRQRVGSSSSNVRCCRSKAELDDEQQQLQLLKQSVGAASSSEMAVSQVTTAAAVSCVESAESDNNGAMVEQGMNLCNASSSPGRHAADGNGDGGGGDCGAARSDQMNNDGKEEREEEEEHSPEVISAAEALDVLAHAAIRLSSSGMPWEEELGNGGESRRALFVHGEIPFVQKRVKRCARPSRASQLGDPDAKKAPVVKTAAPAKAAKARSAAAAAAAPERVSERHSRKRSVDEYDLGPVAKKSRKNEQQQQESPASFSKKKEKKSTSKKKPASKATKTKKPEEEDGDGEEEVAGSSKKRKIASAPKRKKLNAVVKRSEEARQQQQYEEDEYEMDEHLAAAMELQEADEVLGALVRSKRGRNQNLPVRFQGSVMGTWKKGNRKMKPKS